jgi:hypothetical protein
MQRREEVVEGAHRVRSGRVEPHTDPPSA